VPVLAGKERRAADSGPEDWLALYLHELRTACEKCLFFSVSLCLPRACLGKMIVFTLKLLKKRRFQHLRYTQLRR
jgi:hypothetical protein